jgi:hypothetical protein
MKYKILIAAFILSVLSGSTEVKSQVWLDLESGVVFSGYNDVRIPGDQGTLFSLSEELDASPRIFYRIRAGYTFGTRHNLSLLYAPLTVNSEGMVSRDLTFEGVVFPANTELDGIYKFNSYRLTYRYDIVERPRFEFGLGFTAKIRDAKIALNSSVEESVKTNVGFVPIINFLVAWKPYDNLSFVLNGDALAAPQGRAEDILIAAQYKLSDNIELKAGYRILEGGADNDEVYGFALFNYAAVGIVIKLKTNSSPAF